LYYNDNIITIKNDKEENLQNKKNPMNQKEILNAVIFIAMQCLFLLTMQWNPNIQ